jgi:Tol biopolymer transport system component
LGVYEILAPIGAGGMGEVYRARDTKLGRDVALKVLPESFARDLERMARFEREAQVLASLNHPNIATVYGFEAGAIGMELVEGPTLAERIGGRAMPLDEALPIAKQIAEGLEYAHEKGVVHRDLKPANVKLTADGNVRILDFGLAKALETQVPAGNPSISPTLVLSATQAGVILGTAAYMAPEQARGAVVDRRADIWAFGVVLYEMLTGKQPFAGETVSDTLAAVLRYEPQWDAIPVGMRRLVRRCLEKDVRTRLQAIGEARIALDRTLTGVVAEEPAAPKPPLARIGPWTAAVVLSMIVGFALAFAYLRQRPPEPQALRYSIALPQKTTLDGMSLSPDGRYLALALLSEGKTTLWLRALDALESQRLPGTDNARFPFWSPDSRFIGFFTDDKLKKIAVAGGPAQSLCDALRGVGGSWNRDGTIVFGLTASGLQRVSAEGGVSALVSRDEGRPRLPAFLPDGRQFLYLVPARFATQSRPTGIYAGSLDSSADRQLLTDISDAVYALGLGRRAGFLLFVRGETLLAQPFDPARAQLAGDLFPVAEHVRSHNRAINYKQFSVSHSGILAYQAGNNSESSELTWFDREGKRLGALGEPGRYNAVALSPDQKRAAVVRLEPGGTNSDIWVWDLARNTASRLTFDPSVDEHPVWSPDGSRIAFASQRGGRFSIYQKASAGTGSEELLFRSPDEDVRPMDWSRDGQYIVYRATSARTRSRQWLLPLGGLRKPIPFVSTEFRTFDAHFSPDGKWIAYVSEDTERTEVYVRAVPGGASSGPGAQWQVSTEGGQRPAWRADGKELFYLALDRRLMAVPITTGAGVELGAPRPLFQTRVFGFNLISVSSPYSVATDGRRFLINSLPEEVEEAPITVWVNWQAGLKK